MSIVSLGNRFISFLTRAVLELELGYYYDI